MAICSGSSSLYRFSARFFFLFRFVSTGFFCKEQKPGCFHLIILKHTPLCAALNLIILKDLLSKSRCPAPYHFRILRLSERILDIKKFEDPLNPAASEFTRRRPDYPFSVKQTSEKSLSSDRWLFVIIIPV